MIQAESLPRVPSLEGLLPEALPRYAQTLLSATAERALGLRRLQEVYGNARTANREGCFFARLLGELEVTSAVSAQDLALIPSTGPVIVVANHPFGGIEGIVLGAMLGQVRPDVKIMANYLLGGIPELRERMILVDPFGGEGAARSNIRPLRETIEWVRDGGMVAMFPAGEVSSFRLRERRVIDSDWYPTIARLIRATGATVLPVFFRGANGAAFQSLGMIHARLRTMLLPRELVNKQGSTVEVAVGRPVPFRRISEIGSDEELVSFLRMRTYALAHRAAGVPPSRPEPSAIRRQIYPSAIVPPVPSASLAREVVSLPSEQTLLSSGEFEVRYAYASQAPQILREIGRLREVTFRAVGEGTGGPIDIDEFDHEYLHLFVWNALCKEIVGAYRICRVDEILERRGKRGLYTSTLFKFRMRFLKGLGPALEMGRAFIRDEYQRSFAPLLLLWKGIGEYVARNPRYKTLFGPISISSEYRTVSRQLMVRFLEMNAALPEAARHVRPRAPFRIDVDQGMARAIAGTIEDLAWSISDIENDTKDVPVLLRQYLKLGARVLGFNVDAAFGNVVDGLILVDLTQTEPRMLERYMGKENAAAFLALHRENIRAAPHSARA